MRGVVRDCQRASEIVRNCKRLPCTIILALLGIHLNSVNSHPYVAFSRSKVSMRISDEQYRSRIGFHNHFMKQLVTQYKMWNEVMLWLIQMMCRGERHFLRIRAYMKCIRTPTSVNALVNMNMLRLHMRVANSTSLFVSTNFCKTLATTHWMSPGAALGSVGSLKFKKLNL